MILDIIKNVSEKIKNNRHPKYIILKVFEEVGELAKEIKAKYDTNGYEKKGKDGILGEGCDSLITIIDLLLIEGYTKEDILKTIDKKCNKWNEKANKQV